MPQRQVFDTQALYNLLDDGLVAHVSLVRQGYPVIIPVGYARDGNSVLLHGSSGGGLFREAADGVLVAISVTHLDGLVFARSMFDSSMNYRSAMILGVPEVVVGKAKTTALDIISEHLMPGRRQEVRAMTTKEVAATLVLRVQLDEVSVKIRAHGASEEVGDGESREVWAGVLPLSVQPGTPQTSDQTPTGTTVPSSVLALMS